METNELLNEFQSFMDATHDDPLSLSSVQISETRRAFFAGAWAVLCMLQGEDLVHKRNELETKLRRECQDFKQLVVDGAA